MPDVYATITAVEDTGTLERLVNAMEVRAAQPAQQAILKSYLSEIAMPADASVLEIGCGSGAIARVLAAWPGVGEVVGVDPSPYFIRKARELASEVSGLRFEEGNGDVLPFDHASFDVAVMHTVLSHALRPDALVAEAHRVLRPGGTLAVFDGDYATTTVAIGDIDPLQACVDAAMEGLVNDRWMARRMVSLTSAAGFEVQSFRSHGYVETSLDYIVTLLERGADLLVNSGRIGSELAAALKTEARRRAEHGSFSATSLTPAS